MGAGLTVEDLGKHILQPQEMLVSLFWRALASLMQGPASEGTEDLGTKEEIGGRV